MFVSLAIPVRFNCRYLDTVHHSKADFPTNKARNHPTSIMLPAPALTTAAAPMAERMIFIVPKSLSTHWSKILTSSIDHSRIYNVQLFAGKIG